jgi:hypothetical protein
MHVGTDICGTFADIVMFDFFMHAYVFLLDEGKLKPLMDNIPKVYSEFKGEIDNYTDIQIQFG